MSSKLRPFLFPLSILFCLALYWPALNGLPLWDDSHFWFDDSIMRADFSYLTIWRNFAWPMSVSAQKLLFGVFGETYTAHHIINFLIHILNALMVFKLAKTLKASYPFFIYFFFLIHPSNVISVAWMIQLKTLLSFFFSLASILLLLKAQDSLTPKRFYLSSWLLFGAAILSKSAALPVFFVLPFLCWKQLTNKKFMFLMGYFVFTLWGTYKLFASPLTQESNSRVQLTESTPVNLAAPNLEAPRETLSKPAHVAPTEFEIPLTKKKASPQKLVNLPYGLKTLNYYFWQVLLPLDNAPIKGLNYSPLGWREFIHLFFLIIVMILTWGSSAFFYLLSGLMLLAPFYGLLPAPFMNVTWVSDQHLYFALPLFLLFWFAILERVPMKKAFILPLLFIPFLSYKTFSSSKFYKNEISFYEESLRHDPTNVPVSYNLSLAYLRKGDLNSAMNLVETMVHMGMAEPSIRENQFFHQIVLLQLRFQKKLDLK